MEKELVTFQVAKLAKEKGFNWECLSYYSGLNLYSYTTKDHNNETIGDTPVHIRNAGLYSAPTQSLLQKFIRETRGVHIEIHRNASGYYWSMCKADGGTDLGWSDHTGPNAGGVWDSFEDALENVLQVQLSYDLPNDTTIIKHWGNYVEFALKAVEIIKIK